MHRIGVVDTHTGGEPTRVVISGGPELGNGSMADRLAVFRDRSRFVPLGGRQRAPRLGRHGRGADRRAGRSDRRRWRHLLQQRRLSRHVRPRDDRSRRGAGLPGTARPRHAPARDARSARSPSPSTAPILSPSTTSRAIGRPRMWRSMFRDCEPMWATSPGAATGSSWSRITARR